MPIKGAYPVRILPAGLSDAFDPTDAFPGAASLLTNLIFDQGNPECCVSRPGVGPAVLTASQIQTQIGSGTAIYISIHECIGQTVYGMASMSGGTYAGLDAPFAYNFSTASFLPITGYTAANLPLSPATSGPWFPPTIAAVGGYVLFTHPGWSGAGGFYFGAINSATNVWTVQNTATNALPTPPVAVANYNNRAYFACANQSFYSDVLAPLTRTNASQIITHGDPTPVIGYSGLPVTTTSGGVIGQLLVFKPTQIWFVSGDAALGNLTDNYLSLTLGSTAPRSIAQTAQGCYFIGTDGAQIVDQLGVVKPLSHRSQPAADVRAPFLNAPVQSRIAGSFATNVFRVCVPTVLQGSNVINDYWFDTIRSRWNGPHTFAYDCASQLGSYFLLSGPVTGANLFASTPYQNPNSVFQDNGVQLAFEWKSSDFPKTMHVNGAQIVESTQEFGASGLQTTYQVTMFTDEGNTLANCTMRTPQTGVLWDTSGATWDGGATWATGLNVPSTYTVPWPNPIVAPKFVYDITGSCGSSVIVGASIHRYQDTGYVVAHKSS